MTSIYHSKMYQRIFPCNSSCPVPLADADPDRGRPGLREARDMGHWAALVALEEFEQKGKASIYGCPYRTGTAEALTWQYAFSNEKADFIDAVAALRVSR